jgi:hypothetical protein
VMSMDRQMSPPWGHGQSYIPRPEHVLGKELRARRVSWMPLRAWASA